MLLQKLTKILVPLLMVLTTRSADGSDIRGSSVRCSEGDGAVVHVPRITTSDNCYTCTCFNNIVQCEDKRKNCPSITGCGALEEKLPGQCCQKCKGCLVGNGTVIESGASWHAADNPCVQFSCHSGVLTQDTVQCDAGCPGREVPPGPGQCCPSCPVCYLHGYSLKDGEQMPDPADPCRTCKCDRGQLTCQRMTCPVLPCLAQVQYTPRGHCCPQCPRPRAAYVQKDKCLFQNRLYHQFERWDADTCTSCKCTADLVSVCSREGCKPAHTPLACNLDGESHPHDSTWSTKDCRTCRCRHGIVECSRTQCPECPPGTVSVPQPGDCCPACRRVTSPPVPETEGVCTVFGDPHYKTYDGKIYNFQGSCKYLLTKDCSADEAGSASSNFSIRITNDARDTVAFSWLRTVTVRLGGTKVSLLQRMRVKVDGKRVTLPYIKLGVMSVMQDGYRVILRTNEGAKILWDGVSFLELTVPPRMSGRMCGLCGNFNGNPEDDLIGKHGHVMSNGQQFGNSWRVGGKKACSVLPRDVPARPPPCKQDWQANIKSIKHCAAIKSSLFQACHNRIKPEFYFKACRIDMCECPGEQCHCEVLTAYARECERAGVRIPKWRDATGCKNIIPFKYSGENLHSGETSQPNATLNEVLDLGSAAVADNDILNMAMGRTSSKSGPRLRGNKYHPTRDGKGLNPSDLFNSGVEEFDEKDGEDDTKLNLGSIGHAQPVYRAPAMSVDMKQFQRSQTTESERKAKKASRKKQLRKLRRMQRKREKERRRMARKRKKALAKLRGSEINLDTIDLDNPDLIKELNGFTLKRVKERGENKLKWGTGSGAGDRGVPPPFEVILRSESPGTHEDDGEGDEGEEEGLLGKNFQLHQLLGKNHQVTKVTNEDSSSEPRSLINDADLSDQLASILGGSGGQRTNLALLEAGHSISADALNIHRKNWKRRRPPQLN